MTLTAPSPPPVAAPLHAAPVTVYERTRTGLPKMGEYFGDVWRRRPLIWHLARTNLKGEHYDSVLGMVWLVLNPLLLAAVFLFVRSILRPMGQGAEQKNLIDHLIMGVFFFQFVSGCIGSNAQSIKRNRQLVLNMGFPRVIFPISTVVQDVLEFAPVIAVYLAIHTWLGQPMTAALLYLPLILVMLTALNMGFTLLFSPVPVLWPDVGGFLPHVIRVWMYITPVLFTVAEIPSHLMKYMYLNPLFPFFAALEQIFDGHAPDTVYLVVAVGWVAFGFLVGLPFFLMKERRFAARL